MNNLIERYESNNKEKKQVENDIKLINSALLEKKNVYIGSPFIYGMIFLLFSVSWGSFFFVALNYGDSFNSFFLLITTVGSILIYFVSKRTLPFLWKEKSNEADVDFTSEIFAHSFNMFTSWLFIILTINFFFIDIFQFIKNSLKNNSTKNTSKESLLEKEQSLKLLTKKEEDLLYEIIRDHDLLKFLKENLPNSDLLKEIERILTKDYKKEDIVSYHIKKSEKMNMINV